MIDHGAELLTAAVVRSCWLCDRSARDGRPALVPYDAYGTPVETNDMVVLAGERYELVYELPAE